jgi:hypothetical protein
MGRASSTISAHLHLTPIAIVIPHREIARFARLDNDEAVGADSSPSVAHPLDLSWGELEPAVHIVDHDEVVPQAVHLRKVDPHEFFPS